MTLMRNLLISLVSLAFLATPAAAQDVKTLKIATLAPEGSSWMKLFHEWANNMEKRANGKLKVKFYAGGVAGDERDAVRKMRLGQINGGAVTAVGLGLIQPEVRLLELPFMFKGYEELDHVRDSLDADFKKKFEEKGYILLGWGDVGPVHLFTNTPIKSKQDLMQTKIWAWVDDPIVRTLFQQLGLNGVPLGVPDVLPQLQTGMINACYGSPLSTLALQWHSKIKFITSMIISQSIGATVITKKAWDDLGPDLQKIVAEESKALQVKLLKSVRDDNASSLKKMESQGIQVVPTPPALIAEFEQQGKGVAAKLEGQVYSKEFRIRVEKLVADFRAGKK
jgi:TRAP-type C4-dicarboxylate transport system substrate-binding protein